MDNQKPEWKNRLDAFHLRARQDRDSGYCGGCAYYQVKLKDFIKTEREAAAREVVEFVQLHCPFIEGITSDKDALYIKIAKVPEANVFHVLPDTVLDAALHDGVTG